MKKFSQLNFELWGREAVSAYLTHNTDMNETITKIAEDNQLNQEQVKRIVEEANNQAYLQKFASQSDDKYIEFQVAEATKVASTRKKLNEKFASGSVDDYNIRPGEHLYTDGVVTKTIPTPGLEEPTDGEKKAMLYTAIGIQEQFENKMNTLSYDFDEKVKQLKKVAEEDPRAIEGASIYVKTKYEPNSTQVKLASHILPLNQKPNTNVILDTEEEQPFYALLNDTIKVATEYKESYDKGPDLTKLVKLGKRNEKTAAYSEKVQNALVAALVAAGILGTTASVAHSAGYEKGKAVQTTRMSPMRNIIKQYNPKAQ